MAYISYEFYNNVSAKYRDQDLNFNQLKLKVNDTYEKFEKNNEISTF